MRSFIGYRGVLASICAIYKLYLIIFNLARTILIESGFGEL
jgi:hypothetical protein